MEDRATTEMEQVSEPADRDLLTNEGLPRTRPDRHQAIHLGGVETEPGGLAHNDEMEKRLAAQRVHRASQSNKSQKNKGQSSKGVPNPSLLMAVNL
jgi:hypothetical protein